MKYFISLSLALIVLINVVEVLPNSKAPELSQENTLQAALLEDPAENSQNVEENSEEKALIIELLDLYVEKERDLPKAAAVIDQQNTQSELLELYKAKILARSLDFETALEIINRINHKDLALLKAAVLISMEEQQQAQEYLHEIIETHPSAKSKSIALNLLSIYKEHDTHRDNDESYLWLLFAKQFAELDEPEISQHLINKVVSKSPEYRDAWMIKAMNEIRTKDPAAESSLLTAYQLDPGNTQIQYLLGYHYYIQEEYDLSEQYFLYSLQQDSNTKKESLTKLGAIALINDDFALSAHYYEQVRIEDPKNIEALSQLIWLYGEKLDALEKSLGLAQKLQNTYPKNSIGYELLSWIHGKLGNLEEANSYLQQSKQYE